MLSKGSPEQKQKALFFSTFMSAGSFPKYVRSSDTGQVVPADSLAPAVDITVSAPGVIPSLYQWLSQALSLSSAPGSVTRDD